MIIVGGGKVGYHLAKALLEHGHHPVIIEKKRPLCVSVANSLDIPVICGDGSTLAVLESAGVREADSLVGMAGQDEVNLVCCQVAKRIFHVKRTVARVNNPRNVEIMKQLGVDIPISSTYNVAQLVERELDTAAFKQLLSLDGGETTLSETVLPEGYELHGLRLSQIHLPEESVIVSITREGRLIIPRGNTQLLSGDKILFCARTQSLHEVSEVLKIQTGLAPQARPGQGSQPAR